MTRSKLLAWMMSNRQGKDRLDRAFGRKWHEPMRGLMELEIVYLVNKGRLQKTFMITPGWGWTGEKKSDQENKD